MNIIFIILISSIINVIHCFLKNSDFSHENPYYKHYLSTKTPYRFLENYVNFKFKKCNVDKIWTVVRHGTRTPGRLTADLIRNRLVHIRNLILSYCTKNCESISHLNKWVPHKELDDQKRLTHTGEDEMINLGERFGQQFSSILPDVWDNTTYWFQYTDTSRTKASAFYFATGLFGRSVADQVWFPKPIKKDPILRFYKLCEKWRIDVKKNSETLSELKMFLKSDVFNEVFRNFSERFSVPIEMLNVDDIRLMYTTCCFETAWDKYSRSPWCDIFTSDDFKVLEYAKDLEYYWIDGYAYEITTKMGCIMMKDVLSHLINENDRKAVFYFTHSGTVLKFLSYLGLYHDKKQLRHDNYKLNNNRLWRTSKIDAFGSNIAFVLFNCSNRKYVLTLHQERPVILPGCPIDNSYLCPLEIVQKLYENSVNSCDFENMCSKSVFKTLYQSFVKILRSIIW